MNIIDVDIKEIDEGFTIDVNAYTPTLGWSNVFLNIVEYATYPNDGIQDLILQGTPPIGAYQLPVIQIFALSTHLTGKQWFKGVRIRNTSGQVLRTIRTALVEAKPIGNDWCAVSKGGLQGDKVILECNYSGGCQDHDFQLSWDGHIRESFPPQIVLELTHNSNNDHCKALITEQLQFDLSPAIDSIEQYTIYVKSENTTTLVHQPVYN